MPRDLGLTPVGPFPLLNKGLTPKDILVLRGLGLPFTAQMGPVVQLRQGLLLPCTAL